MRLLMPQLLILRTDFPDRQIKMQSVKFMIKNSKASVRLLKLISNHLMRKSANGMRLQLPLWSPMKSNTSFALTL